MSARHRKTRGLGSTPEATLFRQAQNGKRAALNQLMRQHEGLVQAVIRRYGSGRLTYAEALQAGRIGLWHAVLKFDPTRGRAFSTYAWISIMRLMWQSVKTERRQIHGWIPSALRLPQPTSDPAAQWELHAVQQALDELVQRLAPRLRQTLVARYGLAGDSPARFPQIGQQLGVSEERARQLHHEALNWLRQPAHSQLLRSLLGRHTLTDYQALEKLGRCWWHTEQRRHAP